MLISLAAPTLSTSDGDFTAVAGGGLGSWVSPTAYELSYFAVTVEDECTYSVFGVFSLFTTAICDCTIHRAACDTRDFLTRGGACMRGKDMVNYQCVDRADGIRPVPVPCSALILQLVSIYSLFVSFQSALAACWEPSLPLSTASVYKSLNWFARHPF
jgi:hypothetical protein